MLKKLILSCMAFLLTVSFLIPQGLVQTVRAEDQDTLTETFAGVFHENEQKRESGSDESNAYAYIEEDIDKTRLLHASEDTDDRDYLAASYSLVKKGFVTSIKNQNPYGTCWTFATMASAESGIKKKYGKTLDFAELQLAYFFYNSYKKADPMKMITNDGNALPSSTSSEVLDQGGNTVFSTLALASGIGFAKETAYPYTDAASYISGGAPSTCYRATYLLRAARWLSMSEPTTVKKALVNYGALAVAYYHNNNYYDWSNSGDYCFYQNYTSSTNHAVTLVGWDDNFSKNNFKAGSRPSKDGAWLIKNSWGTGWGNEGYFWISYEDTSLKNSMAVFFDVEMADGYAASQRKLYQYDGSASTGYWNLEGPVYEANVFKVTGANEILTDVGFVIDQSDVDYSIYIYRNVSDTPKSGTLAAKQSGHLSDAGYYLIPLEKQLALSKGEKFSVIIRLSASESIHVIADYTHTITYSDGSKFYVYNDADNDISYLSTDGSSWYNASANGDSVRVKAVTINGKIEAPVIKTSMNTDGVLVKWDAIGNAQKYVVYRKGPGESSYTKLKTVTKTSYRDGTAVAGETYTYAVKAYNSTLKKYSAYSNTKKVLFNPFKDVSKDSAHFSKIMWAYNKGIVGGTSKTTFSPAGTCKRRSFALMLWKMYGKPEPKKTTPFKDIDSCTANEKKAIQWCYEKGIVTGTTKTTFSPNNETTRVNVVIMLWKAAGKPKPTTTKNPFKDTKKLTSNAQSAILWAYEKGITKGTSSTTFSPNSACKREQLCTFLFKYNNIYNVVK